MCPGGYGIRPYVCVRLPCGEQYSPLQGRLYNKKRLLHKEKIQVQQPLYG